MKSRIFVVLASLLLSAGMCFGQSTTKDSGQNPGFPRVVARVNLLQRTKALGPETLYTPTKSGLFRVSGALNCTVGNDDQIAAWSAVVFWVNEIGSNQLQVVSVAVNTPQTGVSPYQVVFNASKGQPITLSVVSSFDTSGSQYNAYIVLEQLE